MKKTLCLILVILLASGCAPILSPDVTSSASASPSSSGSSYTPPVIRQTFERDRSESEEFTGSWVVNTEYTREKVIAGQFTAETNEDGARDFAEDFIRANLAPFGVSEISVGDFDFFMRMNIDSGIFYRDAGIYLAEYPVNFKTVSEVPGLANQTYSTDELKFKCLIWIQVVLKQEPRGNCLLLGFVTNQDERISTYVQLYHFLCEDLSYDSSFYTAPKTFESPDTVSVSKILGYRKISDAVTLENGNIAMLLYEIDESDPVSKVQYYLKIFEPDFKTAVNVVRLWKEHAAAGLERLSNGNILVWQTQSVVEDDGTENITYFERRFDVSGKELSSVERSGNFSYLSDGTYILQDADGSLYLVRDNGEFSLLMAGIAGDDPYGMDSFGYSVKARIDDTRFAYSYGGYESSEVKGVCDIETGKTTAFPVKGYYNCTQAFGGKFAVKTTVEYDKDQYQLYLCTVGASGKPILISKGNEKSDGSLPVALSEDGKFFTFAEKTGKMTYNITVIDTQYTWIAAQITVLGEPNELAISGRTLLVFTENKKLTSVKFPDLPAILPEDGYLNNPIIYTGW